MYMFISYLLSNRHTYMYAIYIALGRYVYSHRAREKAFYLALCI